MANGQCPVFTEKPKAAAQDALHCDTSVEVVIMKFGIVERLILAAFWQLLASTHPPFFSNAGIPKSLMSAMLMKFPVFATWPSRFRFFKNSSPRIFLPGLSHLDPLTSERKLASSTFDAKRSARFAPGFFAQLVKLQVWECFCWNRDLKNLGIDWEEKETCNIL